MSLAASIRAALKTQQAALADVMPSYGNPKTFAVKVGVHTSAAIAAAISLGDVGKTFDERDAVRVVQLCTVSVKVALMPSWATVEDMPKSGSIIVAGKSFVISSARLLGHTIEIQATRRP
jgi:hypothetical protein